MASTNQPIQKEIQINHVDFNTMDKRAYADLSLFVLEHAHGVHKYSRDLTCVVSSMIALFFAELTNMIQKHPTAVNAQNMINIYTNGICVLFVADVDVNVDVSFAPIISVIHRCIPTLHEPDHISFVCNAMCALIGGMRTEFAIWCYANNKAHPTINAVRQFIIRKIGTGSAHLACILSTINPTKPVHAKTLATNI